MMDSPAAAEQRKQRARENLLAGTCSREHMAVRARPPGAVKRHGHFPQYIGFVWGSCVGVQGA